MGLIEELKNILGDEGVKLEEAMSRHTSFKVGGNAQIFVEPGDEEALQRLLKFINAEKIDHYIIGNGSNMLVSDKGYKGIIISMLKFTSPSLIENESITISAGKTLKELTEFARDNSLSGLEFAYGIPGSVGGAVFMNAGAYDGEIKEVLDKVKVMDKEGNVLSLNAGELDLSYRHSNIEEKGYIVLEAKFNLKKADKSAIWEKMQELMARRIDKQPLNFPSAGSTFKRPEGYFAGKLIDDAGLRGYSIGGAKVSDKHCGFIVNADKASAEDVYALISYVRLKVKDRFGVELEPELRVLGEF